MDDENKSYFCRLLRLYEDDCLFQIELQVGKYAKYETQLPIYFLSIKQ